MKRIVSIFGFLLISISMVGQLYLTPNLSAVYLQQNGVFGLKISNNMTLKKGHNNFEIGLDFVSARGNKNVDLKRYNKYTFEYLGYAPAFDIPLSGPSFWSSFPQGLNPLTSSTRQFNIKIGFLKTFKISKLSMNIGGGFYASYVSTYYLIGTFENTSISFPNFAPAEPFDLVFPVSLRYINLGFYTKAEIELFPNKKQPVNLELQYYWGQYHSGLWSLGVNFPFILDDDQ